MKLLLIDDDRGIGTMLADACTSQDWVLEQADDGETGLALALSQAYDLILLDLQLPAMDGITVCKRLRTGGYRHPILLLTGQDSPDSQVEGLDAGADDYVTKPFELEVLLARIRALGRKGKSLPSVITWESLQLDQRHGSVQCHSTPIHLTAKEYCLLELFLLNPKRIYSRRAILDRLWDFADSPGEATVSTHIKCIRQKLKAAGSADPIETVHGLGYRLRSPTTAPPPLDSRQEKVQAVVAKVWNQFKTHYLEQTHTLTSLIQALQPQTADVRIQEIRQIAHQLAGSMGMFGFMAASQQAKQLEQLMQADALEATQIETAKQYAQFLTQAIAGAQATLPPTLQPWSAQGSSPALAARLLIVEDDRLFADRLRIEAIAWNLEVEIATDLGVARQMIAQRPPSLILLDLSFPGEENGLDLLRQLAQTQPHIPVVILTASEDLRDRVVAARLGGQAFLHKPLPAYEILKTATHVLYRTTQVSSGDRVLIVDDDPAFLQALSLHLETAGMQVSACAKPEEFWHALAAANPEALILDLEMPAFDGVELCQVVRADPHWQRLKVIFLSAHREAAAIARAYAAGADDYLDKTTPIADVVARIQHRIGHFINQPDPQP